MLLCVHALSVDSGTRTALVLFLDAQIMNYLNFRVLVADDHPAICLGVRHALSQGTAIDVTCASRGAGGMQQALDARAYDVLVCEYAMLDGLLDDVVPCLETIRQRYPGLRIVILTCLENAGVVHALLARGVQCIVSKLDELSHLMPAILSARSDSRYLSPRIEAVAQSILRCRKGPAALTGRELEVVRLFLSGMTVNEIAFRLDRSKKTISTQKSTAMLKLGLQRDIELLRYGIETGLVGA